MEKRNPIDTLDLSIINHLRLDGRKSFTDIAAEEGVSVGTIRNRYAQLVEHGVLQIAARLSPHTVGLNIYAQVLIAVRPSNLLSNVIDQIAVFPEVSFLAQVTGEYDLELNVMCRDNDHLQELLESRLQTIPGVEQTRTNIYLRLVSALQPDLSKLLIVEGKRGSSTTDSNSTNPQPVLLNPQQRMGKGKKE